MELTLKRLLKDAEFKKSRGKGYDPGEVDDFMKRASAMANKVEMQLSKALSEAESASGPSKDEVEAEIERRVAERAAEAPPLPSEDDRAEEMRRTLIMAQRTADAAVAEARDDAAKIVAAATEQSETMLADATARSESLNRETDARAASAQDDLDQKMADKRREARARLADEIAELEGIREALRSDVNLLERHVEEQRSQLGSTLAELQQVLDDPAGFRLAPAPALSDPELPDFSDMAEPAEGAEADAGDEADDLEATAEAADDAVGDRADQPTAEDPDSAAGADAESVSTEPTDEPKSSDAGEASEGSDDDERQRLAFGEVDHVTPGLDDIDDIGDAGPPTVPVSAIELGLEVPPRSPGPGMNSDTDDAFLAELRKAMSDDEPLGPRDDDGSGLGKATLGDRNEQPERRFGRRR